MKQRAVMSVAVFESPIYLLVVGPFGVVGIPVVTVLFGGQVCRSSSACGCSHLAAQRSEP